MKQAGPGHIASPPRRAVASGGARGTSAPPPPFLEDPLTLSQPGGGTLSPPITMRSSRFSERATALPPHHVIIIRTLLDKSSHHSTPQDITYFSPAESKSKSDVHRWQQKNKTENYEMGNFQFLSRPQRIMHKIFSNFSCRFLNPNNFFQFEL